VGGTFDMRTISMEMAIPVHCTELAYETGAQQAHRHLLEPAVTQLAGDEHDLGPVRLGKARGQRLRDPLRGEILILDIEIAPGARDHVEIEVLHMPHRRRVFGGRTSAGDANRYIGELGGTLGRPWCTCALASRTRI